MSRLNTINPSSTAEINSLLKLHPEWVYADDSLKANFEFADFDDAIEIITTLVVAIRELDHHPFWSNEYNKLSFTLCTHEANNKVTQQDLNLAKVISELIKGQVG